MASVSVLFVCMGNICRSPMAEAVFRARVAEAGLADRVRIDSAGTHSYHLGHTPHEETVAELGRRGIDVGDQVSRLVSVEDFDEFDYIVAMDDANMRELTELAARAQDPRAALARTFRLLEHATDTDELDVPDPYYVGGYDVVYELVDDGTQGLLALVQRDLGVADLR